MAINTSSLHINTRGLLIKTGGLRTKISGVATTSSTWTKAWDRRMLLALDEPGLRCYSTQASLGSGSGNSMNRCPWCKTPFRLNAVGPRPTNVQWTDGYAPGSFDKKPALRCTRCERCFFKGDGPTDLLSRGEEISEVETVNQAEELYAALVQSPGWEREQEVRLRLLAWRADNQPLRRKYEPSPPWGILALGCLLSLGILLLGYWLHWQPGARWHEFGSTLIQIGAELVATILTCLPLAALCWIFEELEYRRLLKAREQPDLNQRFFLNLQALYQLLRSEEPKERLLKAEAARQLGRFEDALVLVAEPAAVESAPVVAKIRQLATEGNRLVHPV